mgnify:CR=1 FL=1
MRYALFFLLFFSIASFGQKKNVEAIKKIESIVIDGNLSEWNWNQNPIATNFVMFEPDNGVPISKEKRTEIQLQYDNQALYIAVKLYDDAPNLIQKELTQRDNFGVSDHFGVYINGFNDGQQDFRFFVSAAGVQMDCLATETNEDYSWDAIWESSVKITDEGWQIEFKIPYAALRFSEIPEQVWGLNFMRELRRDRQKYFWNPINANVAAIIPQAGLLTGIQNIKPPTRLFFIPYTSAYAEKNQNSTTNTYKLGMDLKYGITDAFTLDAILIPDFGQTAFDNVELNLGPFEQQFNENRPFFTEGTDIFNKGDLLYTRRIGGPPSGKVATTDDETASIPTSVNLFNATKISGRTKNGLGIGFLNAITEPTNAKIINTVDNTSREIEVEPITNYNVTVLDQRFNQNSSVSFVNTNVWRNGDFRDANVSAALFDLNTKANTYNLSGDLKYSHIKDFNNTDGFSTSLNFGRTFSKHRYNFKASYTSKDYNINDLGINFITNFHSLQGNYNYRILNPTKLFNTLRFNTDAYAEFQNETGRIQDFYNLFSLRGTTLKNDFFQFGITSNPLETYDFYESRVSGQWLNIPSSIGSWFYVSTNYNRKFALDFELNYRNFDQENRENCGFYFAPRYRISNRVSLVYDLNYFNQKSDIGWVDFFENQTILGERNRTTVTNSLKSKISINNKMNINLVGRYYWSYAENIKYHTLLSNGTFTQNALYPNNRDSNLNLWNFDLSYSWWFAPGSEISVLYRNNANSFNNEIQKNINENVSQLFNNNLNHIFSVSIRYFVDYNIFKKSS